MGTETNADKKQIWLRDSVLVVGVLMAFALSWMAYSLDQRIDRASSLVTRGRAEVFLDQMRKAFHPSDEARTKTALQAMVVEHSEAGLRYVAIITPNKVFGEAGTTYTPLPTGPLKGGEDSLDKQGDRVRFVHSPQHPPPGIGKGPPRPPGPRSSKGPDGPPMPPVFGGPGRPGGPQGQQGRPNHPPLFVFEFEPLVADELEGQGTFTLMISGFGALVSLVGAVLIWLLLRQRESVMAQLLKRRQLAALGEMSAVMAHELRNPLASAKGHAQLLSEFLDSGSRLQKKADYVVSELVRLEGLTNDLLAFVRSGRISRSPTHPVELVQTIIDRQNDPRLELVACDDPGTWSLDPVAMERVISNLAQNALQASPSDTPVTVTVDVEGNLLLIAVRDRGEGIPPEKTREIFEPFITTRVRGTGLGLAVSQQIIEAHDGTIEATNHPDGGALFCCRLPHSAS